MLNSLWIPALCMWAGMIVFYDLTQRLVPNALSLGAIAFALIFMLLFGQSYYGPPISSAFGGLAVAFLLTVPGYASHTLGGGDVKLLMAISLLCGLKVVLLTFVLASLTVLAIVLLVWYFSPRLASPGWMNYLGRGRRNIPYGAALAASMIIVVLFPGLWEVELWQI